MEQQQQQTPTTTTIPDATTAQQLPPTPDETSIDEMVLQSLLSTPTTDQRTAANLSSQQPPPLQSSDAPPTLHRADDTSTTACALNFDEVHLSDITDTLYDKSETVNGLSEMLVLDDDIDATPVAIERRSDTAKMPTRGSERAAGWDLYASADATIAPKGRALVPTDIAIAVPYGCYARIAPRSGLAVKHGIDVFAGVVDSDYRGTVGVVLFNAGDEPFQVAQGDRIAQLILEKIDTRPLVEVDKLDDTARAAGGFGSTGI